MNEEEIRHLSQSYYDIHQKYDKLQQENEQLKTQNDTLMSALILTRQKYKNDKARYRRKAKDYRKRMNRVITFANSKFLAQGGATSYDWNDLLTEILHILRGDK